MCGCRTPCAPSSRARFKPLITNEFPLADLKAGFDLADKDDAAIKIVFRP